MTPADRLVRIDILPGDRVLFTFGKTQVSPDGETIIVVVARIEWSLDHARAVNVETRMLLDGGALARMEPKNALPG